MYAVEPLAHPLTATPAGPAEVRVAVSAAPGLPRELVFNGRDEWQSGLQQHLLAMHCSPVDAPGFKCNAVLAQLCGNRFAELRVDASRLERREPADAADRDSRQIKVIWQLAGRSRVHQGRNCATLDAGHWTICDTGRDYVLDFEHSARCMLILVPRAQCTGWLTALDTLAALALPASGPAQMAQNLLSLLLRGAAVLDGRSERALHESVVALIEQGLSTELEKRGRPALTRRSTDLARVQTYVLDHIADKRLSVERIAAAFGMSRRSLYNLFASLGVTPHAFIQQARLNLAGAMLSDHAARDIPVLRIAEQCGFADAAHFSRAFHAHYGASPNAWRGRVD